VNAPNQIPYRILVTKVGLDSGTGDHVQTLKAGVLEIADILVVNKADLAGADLTVQQFKAMLALRPPVHSQVPVLQTTTTTASRLDELVDAIDHHGVKDGGDSTRRRRAGPAPCCRRAAAATRRVTSTRSATPSRTAPTTYSSSNTPDRLTNLPKSTTANVPRPSQMVRISNFHAIGFSVL
jgi:putative protein kinase ArgK-like GTPase of G3E family